jgi:flagellar basal-body rod modification protein FlgD
MTIATQGVDPSAARGGADGAIAVNGEMTRLFTTLLIAQIKNQNPLEPTDASEFVNQLTQLSQVESMQQMVAQSSASAAMLESIQVMALGAQVGSNVTAVSDRVVLDDAAVPARFTLADGSASVAVVLEGATGERRRIELGTRPAGAVDLEIDPRELGLQPGTYSLRVETATGEAPAVEVQGTLQSVRLSATEGVVLQVSNLGSIGARAITAFNGRPQ